MTPTTEIQRFDLSLSTSEFNLEMSRRGFIGHRVFRPLSVGEQSASFLKMTAEGLIEPESDNTWAERTSANEIRGEWGQDSYATTRKAVKEGLTKRMVQRYRNEINAENVVRKRIIDAIAREYEVLCAAAAFSAATFSGDLTSAVGTAWSTKATADPVGDIDGKRQLVIDKCGHAPNALVLEETPLLDMVRTDRIESLLKFSGEMSMTEITGSQVLPELADLLQLDEIIVAKAAVKRTSKKGQAVTYGRIWDKTQALLCRVGDSPDLEDPEPVVGRTLMWSEDGPGVPGASDEGIGVLVEQWPDNDLKGDYYRAVAEYLIKIMHAIAAHRITGLA